MLFSVVKGYSVVELRNCGVARLVKIVTELVVSVKY